MASSLFLHIGTQKSGTTYLQRTMQTLSAKSGGEPILYPRAVEFRDGKLHDHWSHDPACYGALKPVDIPWVSEVRAETQKHAWSILQSEVQACGGATLVSAESLSRLRTQAASDFIDSFDVADVRIIITGRDLGRVLPSSWQQVVRNTRTQSFDSYLTRLVDLRGDPSDSKVRLRREEIGPESFWRAYALGELAERWSRIVGADRVTLVTVPRSGANPNLLYERFHSALGSPNGLPLQAPVLGERDSNMSMSLAEATIFSQFTSIALTRGIPHRQIRSLMEKGLKGLTSLELDRGPQIRVPLGWQATVNSWANEDVDRLKSLGIRLVGDFADLLPQEDAFTASELSPENLAQIAAHMYMNQLKDSPRAKGLRRQAFQISEMKAELSQQVSQISEMKAELSQQVSQISEMEGELKALTMESERLVVVVAQSRESARIAERDLSRVLNSRSWKLIWTVLAPVRFMRKLNRKLVRKNRRR